MTSDIGALIEFYEKEKAIDRSRVVQAMEYSFCTAYRKMNKGADRIENLRAEIHEKKGDVVIFANLEVVEDDDHVDKWNEVPLSTAQKLDPQAQVGDHMDFNVTPKNFGRIAVQTAKQTIVQQLRAAEKEKMFDEFKDRAGDIVSGTVRRFEKKDVLIDVGKFEARMPGEERVPSEDYHVGDRIRAYVMEVRNDERGPEILLSRRSDNFVRRLFESEVAEISDRTVELRAVARDPGFRTKVAVATNDDNIDPVGACVGMRGARVKNIVRELNNEKVDIVRWSENLQEMVADALKPVQIRTFVMGPIDVNKNSGRVFVDSAPAGGERRPNRYYNPDEWEKVQGIHITVDEEEVDRAIGRRGQNAWLTGQLVGYPVKITKDVSKQEKFEAKKGDAASALAESLNIPSEQASKIYTNGGATVDDVIDMGPEFLADILEISEDEAQEIVNAAEATNGAEGSEEEATAES